MDNRTHAYRLTAGIMAISAVVVVALTMRIQQLEADKVELHEQLHEAQSAPDRCTPVQVTCVCPEYDEGWEDAQFAEGCDPSLSEMPIEELRVICDELEGYGYVPGC